MKYQNILQDIKGEFAPVGMPDEDGAIFFAIDEQVMKFGSLQHDSIDWDNIIINSQKYLSEVCKDYKVLQYLGYASLYTDFSGNFIEFIEIFYEFNEKYLFPGYPKPSKDNTISRFKEKFIGLILERIENAVNNNPGIAFSTVDAARLEKLLDGIYAQLSSRISNLENIFNRIKRQIRELTNTNGVTMSDSKESVESNKTTGLSNKQILSHGLTQPDIPNVNDFDLQNSRKLRQLYLQIADMTYSIEPTSMLGYICRRFGLWHSITQLPEMDVNGVTVMQAIPSDKLSDYRELVLSSPSVELLYRIEKTITTSPYWVEGSYLSAKCCHSLKMNEVAEVIKHMTKQFVNKFSAFPSARFHNGEPFLPESVSAWLEEESSTPKELKNIEQEANNFDEVYESEGFLAVLKLIDEQLKLTTDIRSKNYLQFEKIRYFLKEEMFTIALNELSELIDNCKKYTVEEWDNNFFKQLSVVRDKLLKDNQ